MVRKHDDTLFVNLLGERLELDHDWLCLTGFDCSHGVEDYESTEGAQSLQSQSLLHRTHVFDKDFLSLLEGHGDFTEFKHISVGHECLWDSCSPDLEEERFYSFILRSVYVAEINRQKPAVVLCPRVFIIDVKVSYSASQCLKDRITVESLLKCAYSRFFS